MPARRMEIVDRFSLNNRIKVHIRNVISGATAPKFIKFLHGIAASSPVLMPYADGAAAFRFKTPAQRLEPVKLDVCKKRPKLIGYHSNVSWTISKRTHISIKAKYLAKIGRACSEIIGRICLSLPFFCKSTKICKRFSGVTIITEFVYDVATFNALLMCLLAFWYSNVFGIAAPQRKLFHEKADFATLIGCHRNVP